MITADEVFRAQRLRTKGHRQGEKPSEDNYHHNVYVVELDPAVLKDRKFRAANKGCDPAKTCFYVGSTGLAPQERFRNHKKGYKANRFVKRYGLRLRPDLFDCYNPMPWEAAVALEVELAAGFREDRHAVWQN